VFVALFLRLLFAGSGVGHESPRSDARRRPIQLAHLRHIQAVALQGFCSITLKKMHNTMPSTAA
jgi:hypothetical protein